MAQAMPIIMLATTVLSTGYSIYRQAEAASEAKKLADKNAKAIELETEEAARRAQKDADRAESLAKARANAGDVGGATVDLYLQDLERTNDEQIDWIKKSGASRADIARAGGRAAESQAHAGMASTFMQGTSSAYQTGFQAGYW